MEEAREPREHSRCSSCGVLTGFGRPLCPDCRRMAVPSAADRFWARVDRRLGPDDCWLWLGNVGQQGYGTFNVAGLTTGAHRFALSVAIGPIPDGLMALHTCDNKLCVRPDHLYAGTHADNARDAVQRGRIATGDRHGRRTHPEKWRRPRQEVSA